VFERHSHRRRISKDFLGVWDEIEWVWKKQARFEEDKLRESD